ncbi:MAG: type II toxin-antitoxin system HicB family antitoxin [Lachnospiraceae bacterium]|nr:type II toxin-antitoxin system HicB family antitoxin [Lachnospiraceae bacterium]MDY3817684.1 type II toxin-antitoxin system HicB family antitoxin [Lachnospiraceae bacterium]
MQNDRYSFVALFDYADDGISIVFPDLPGCYPCADKDDTDMALKNAKEALGLHIWGMEQDHEEIPVPSKITDLEIEPGQVPVLIDVFMPPIRERINSRFVKKTLSLPAWLASKADEDGVNCSRIFQNALMDYLGIRDKTKI